MSCGDRWLLAGVLVFIASAVAQGQILGPALTSLLNTAKPEIMVPSETAETAASIRVRVFDGRRQLIAPGTQVLVRVIDGNQKEVFSGFFKNPNIFIRNVPFYDNLGDNYTVIVSAKHYRQAGFTPVHVRRNQTQTVDLMLIPQHGRFDFTDASWDSLAAVDPALKTFLTTGVSEDEAKRRYEGLKGEKSAALACLLNITAALSHIHLPKGNILSEAYLHHIEWDNTLAQDRFYAYAPLALLTDVEEAAKRGEFAREYGEKIFHPGAITSYKQIEFGEANVQLTFHHMNKMKLRGVELIEVEIDIDYYKDLLAHFLLEIVPNRGRHGITDPRVVYQLRWIAGRRAGAPEFDPHYAIVGR